MKKKAHRRYCAHVTAKWYEQVNGEHYNEHSIAAPVADDMTFHVILVLTVMTDWIPQFVNVKGGFGIIAVSILKTKLQKIHTDPCMFHK